MDEAAVRAAADDSADLQRRYFADNAGHVLTVGRRIADVLRSGGKVLTFGNGGSAADAQHFAAELVGRYLKDRPAWCAIALTTDTSILTSVANHFGYDAVSRPQVRGRSSPARAARAARAKGSAPAPLDLAGVRTYPLEGRRSKVGLADFARPHVPGAPLSRFLDGLPRILGGQSFRALVDDVLRGRTRGRPIVGGRGAHVIKAGLSPAVID